MKPNAVMTGLVPVIHVVKPPESFELTGNEAAWMAGLVPICANLEFIMTYL
jgi:hypothetical protein